MGVTRRATTWIEVVCRSVGFFGAKTAYTSLCRAEIPLIRAWCDHVHSVPDIQAVEIRVKSAKSCSPYQLAESRTSR
jgi:hypothetical protein